MVPPLHIFVLIIQKKNDEQEQMEGAQWTPNLSFFVQRLGKYPDRIENIYFTFLFLLRAVNKASKELTEYNYETGNPIDDQKVKENIFNLFSSKLLEPCSQAFNESSMFLGSEKQTLKNEFKNKFKNISEIMDCVSCESCKLHAKLQVLGIATALKILLSENHSVRNHLQRNEIIALVNTLFKFSESIEMIQMMSKEVNEQVIPTRILFVMLIIVVLIISIFILRSCCRWLFSLRKSSPLKKKKIDWSNKILSFLKKSIFFCFGV